MTKFRVKRAARGRRVSGTCVAPTRRNRRAPLCTRWVQMRGSFSRVATRGANSFRFTGRLGGKKLRPGDYRLIARARDSSAYWSPRVRAPFAIRR